jgi:hypothetical protein
VAEGAVSVGVRVAGQAAVAASFLSLRAASDARTRAIVRHHGALLRTRVMRNASGRPGPNVVTGDYRRSISVQYVEEGGVFVAVVGTNSPQGRRLEFGFHGADSLGRVYNQPPFPHFGPALQATAPEFVAAFKAIA